MKTKTTSVKLLLTTILLFGIQVVNAQISAVGDFSSGTLGAFCSTENVSLTASSTGGATFAWQRYSGITATGTPTNLSETGATMTDTPPAPGYYTYVSYSISADGCTSVASDPAIIYYLPGITATVSAQGTATTTYCENNFPTTTAIPTLTAVAGEATTVTENFTYKYQWYKNGTAIPSATNSTYVLNSTDDIAVGANNYTVKVTYNVKACTETESSPIAVTVTAKPTKPTISL